MKTELKKNTFKKRLLTMLGVDFKRLFISPLYYIVFAVAFVVPVLILVMAGMMGGEGLPSGEQAVTEGFTNVWKIIGTVPTENSAITMDITSMCNINMAFFAVAVFVCVFVGSEFQSGYAKNLFAVRASKVDYVTSKSLVCHFVGASIIIAFFAGAMLGGGIVGLPFDLVGVTGGNVVACIFSKLFLLGMFVSVYLFAAVVAKSKLWLSLIISFGVGMIFFMVIPIVTPLNASAINVVLCFVGSVLFSVGVGAVGCIVLRKTSLA